MKPVILVFGESDNDAQSIAKLIPLLNPKLKRYAVAARRDPVIHLRNTDLPKTRRSVSESIAKVVRAERVRREVVSVIAHQDADACEPAHQAIVKTIEVDLNARGVPKPIAAVPAWELESWLLLFPEAIARTRRCWKMLDLGARHTGQIEKSKEFLQRSLRPPGTTRCPDYVESDSPLIVYNVLPQDVDPSVISRRSASLACFRTKLLAV